MRHLFLYFSIFLFLSKNVSSQALNNVMKVEYDFYLNLGGNQHYNSLLYVSNDESLFMWGRLEKNKKLTNDNGNDFTIDLTKQDDIGTYNYTNNLKDSIYTRFTWMGNKVYLLIEEKTNIKWEILNKTKQISDFNCQLAKANFRGRIYFAWFTTELTFNASPWKLNGLPGVILEAYDSNKKIQFILKKIEIYNNENIFDLPKENMEKISLKQYSKIQSNLSKDFKNKIKSKLPRGAKIETKSSESIEIFNID